MVTNKLNAQTILKKIENSKEDVKKIGVKKIGLFGSFVKDKQKNKSDVDILVTFDKPSFDSYARTLILLEKLFRRKIDLVMEDSLIPELRYVKKETKYAKL